MQVAKQSPTPVPASAAGEAPEPAHRGARRIAAICGILGFVLAIASPLLPVRQQAASVSWPQAGALTSVTAPLVAYAPTSLTATVPCSTLVAAGASAGDSSTLVISTVPGAAPKATDVGLIVAAGRERAEVILRSTSLVDVPLSALTGRDCRIVITSDATATTAAVIGAPGAEAAAKAAADGTADPASAEVFASTISGDSRPQVVGIFSDLDGAAPAGMAVHIDIDSRFSTSPSSIKRAALIAGILATLTSLLALRRLDATAPHGQVRLLRKRWWRPRTLDLFVGGTLVTWYLIGATTSDDGYILTMARNSQESGYMANYYRWFGVTEKPFGWYYDVLGLLTHVSSAGVWIRLPALILAGLGWFTISREILPRLGVAVRTSRPAAWSAAAVYLAMWMSLNNGLRYEPVIAVGTIITWCFIERAIATRRIAPLAAGIIAAAFTLGAGPTGLMAVAVIAVAIRPLLGLVAAAARRAGTLATLAPLAASGTLLLFVVFADETLATVRESARVKGADELALSWFEEVQRYYWLFFTTGADGSLNRRFAVLMLLLCLVMVTVIALRRGRIPGTALGPSQRLVFATWLSFAVMAFTPTKWTHQFGAFAGIAGAVAGLAAVAVGPAVLRSVRNRYLVSAALMLMLSFSLTAMNAWWYVSSYAIMWFDKPPSLGGHSLADAALYIAVVLLALAGREHLLAAYPGAAESLRFPLGRRTSAANHSAGQGTDADQGAGRGRISRAALAICSAPIAVLGVLMVLFYGAVFAKGAAAQYPAFSIAKANLAALTGDSCAMASEAMVETDPLSGVLSPMDPLITSPLGAVSARGFTRGGVPVNPDSLNDDEGNSASAGAVGSTAGADSAGGGSTGGTESTAIRVPLPFGLDPETTEVLGSYSDSTQQSASLESAWYQLPVAGEDNPLLVITAAGRIASINTDGVLTAGNDLFVTYGVREPDGVVRELGQARPMDPGPTVGWRNLRIDRASIPREADVLRLSVTDSNLDGSSWVAVTAPRLPALSTLGEVVSADTPALIDWGVALMFPCQRPVYIHNGVAEVPRVRILPDRGLAVATTAWQDAFAGGPGGWVELLGSGATVPSYLANNWGRDYGSLQQYSPYDADAVPAEIAVTDTTRWGWWSPGPMQLPGGEK